VYALAEMQPDLERCIAEAGALVEQVGRRIASDVLS
jgi:hypothetical protein